MRLNTFNHLLTSVGACLATVSAAAQGADDCSNPQVISGSGPFAFDTTAATTDGHPEAILGVPGVRQLEKDVWFSWTAASTGAYEVSTCFPQTTGATAIAVYEFGCTTTQGRSQTARGLSCGIFTTLTMAAESGTTYLIRIGVPNTGAGATGDLTITQVGLPGVIGSAVNPANGRTYHFLEPSSWSVARIAAVSMGGDLVTVNDQAENDWLLQTFWSWGGQQRSFWIGYSDAETEGTWTWADGDTSTFTNWSNPPNNGNGYEHYAHFRMDWNDGTWNDLIGDPDTGFFYSDVHGVVEVAEGGIGQSYCGPAFPNSSGMAAIISATGTTVAASNDVTLVAEQLPTGQFGYFLAGRTQGFFNPPGSSGFICLSGNIGRYNSAAEIIQGPTGSLQLDLTSMPVNPPQPALAGETWNFQCWYRDNNPTLTSNFTDGLTIAFQ